MRSKLLYFSIAMIQICFIPTKLKAQSRSAQSIINQRNVNISQYEINTDELETFKVEMGFGSADIMEQLKDFQVVGQTIHHIDLVYSDYPKGANLKTLNLNRIKEIEKFFPVLVENPLIKWRIIRQTACQSEVEARSFFHGVVVYYEATSSPEFLKEVSVNLDKYLPIEPSKIVAQKIFDTMRKPTVNTVLSRQKNWSNAVFIVDLTSSMIPYNSQIALWQLLNTENGLIKEIVMFNDGDSAPIEAKTPGKTGGIYHLKSINYKAIRNESRKVCTNGLGNNDQPENDLEAVLFAIEKNPNASEYILVADNDAPPRDMELLDKIYRPIRIILCDTDKGILPEYLEIARKTGGSVHTLKEDIVDLIKKKEGETIVAGGRKYKVKNGRILVVN
jgi:hypothetical protein